MRAAETLETALLILPFAVIFVLLGFLLVHAGRASDAFKAECHAQGGAIIQGYRGPDLCVRNGLIIMPKGDAP